MEKPVFKNAKYEATGETEKGGSRVNQICVMPDFLLGLLEEVGKTRALKDHETDVLELIVSRGHKSSGFRIKWTTALDRELLRAAITRGEIRKFAAKHGFPENAAYQRVKWLKARKG